MPKVRKEIPELEKLVQVGRKKFVRYEEGCLPLCPKDLGA